MLKPSRIMVDKQQYNSQSAAPIDEDSGRTPSVACQNHWLRVFRVEWLGQTAASLCWIASVIAYGISSSGDWLQLFAASSWLLANIAAAITIKVN